MNPPPGGLPVMMNCSKNGIRMIGVGGNPPPGQHRINGVIVGNGVAGGDVFVGVAVGAVDVVVAVVVFVMVAVVVVDGVAVMLGVKVADAVGVAVRVEVAVGVGVQTPPPPLLSLINRPW